jgi:hypothetical protein
MNEAELSPFLKEIILDRLTIRQIVLLLNAKGIKTKLQDLEDESLTEIYAKLEKDGHADIISMSKNFDKEFAAKQVHREIELDKLKFYSKVTGK